MTNGRLTGTKPRQIGSRLELFVDDWLIDRMSNGLNLKLHAPRPAEVVLRFDQPWEGRWSGYVTVLQDDDLCRMYYRAGLIEGPLGDAEWESVAYSQSTDGIDWQKPDLGLFEFNGSKQNNMIWKGPGAHTSFGVFRDTQPDCRPQHRYKAVSSDGYNLPVYAFGSPDAIHWEMITDGPIITEFDGAAAAYDSPFCGWWDDIRERYVMFHRAWYRPVKGKVRSIATRTSKDFIHWTPLQLIDFGDAPPENIYTSAIKPYFRGPHILLGFPRRFWPGRRRLPDAQLEGISDTVFISSRDGLRFDRRFMESFIRPGPDRLHWLSRSNTVALGMVQTSPEEISLYVSHCWGDPTQYIRRYVLRTDGFVSVNGSYAGGELITTPLLFDGQKLVINYATSAAGSVRVGLADLEGKPIPGFETDRCPEIYGDAIEEAIHWKDEPDLGALVGRPVRLCFLVKDADLYSFRFL